MNARGLVEQLLSVTNEKERQVLLESCREELNLECFEEFKARSDALLLEQPSRALEIAEVAMHVASFASTPLVEAIARWARGNSLVHLGRYEQALEDFRQACTVYSERTNDQLAVARLETNMVAALKNLARYEEALRMADAAREALQPWGQSRYLIALEMNVASTYRLMGRYEEALAAYDRGRAIFAAMGNRVQVARVDINRARALGYLDRFREAEELLLDASSVLAEEGKALPAARATLNLATLLSRQGRHRQALETYTQARDAFDALGVETDVAVVDLYRTYDTLALNLLPETLELAAEAHDFLVQQDMSRHMALAAGNQAVAARKMGRYAEALDALHSAREIFAARKAAVEVALLDVERAICLRQKGDPQAAVGVVTEALSVLDDHNLPLQAARARLTLAACLLAMGEVEEAASLYFLAQKALEAIPSLAWQAHDGLGQVAEARGEMQKALHHYQDAIACIETAEEELGIDEYRAGFLDDKLEVYQRAVRLALALGDQEMAFNHTEQSKTGVWRDYLVRQEPESEAQTRLQALRREWHWLYNRLTRPDEDEDTLRGSEFEKARWAKLHSLERQIAQARREISPTLARHPGLSLSAVQQRIPAGTLLLDYYCTTQEVIVFLISAREVRVFERLAPLAAVERAINRWRFNIESMRFSIYDGQSTPPSRLTNEAQDVLCALYRLLLEPLELAASNYCRLWIVPHGLLFTVPFAALCDDERYLVERFELACLPGLASLEQDRRTEAPALSDAPVVIGYSEGERLLNAVNEARAVADTLGANDLLLEDEATTERLRATASSCTLLHLATHGFFRADAPLFSALHLADGALTAGDLEEWTLPHAGLVTLSACETGVILSWGSDLLGLVRGFFRTGVRQLVVSLWAVDDASTAKLMAHFYGGLRAEKAAAPALRGAQIAILEQYRHPFYWAGFEVMALL